MTKGSSKIKRVTKQREVLRFAAKLLYQFRVEYEGVSDMMRLCEERIVSIPAKTPRLALAVAKRRGKSDQHVYKNDAGANVHIEFVGVMDLLHLGVECQDGDVWYELTKRKMPMEHASKLIPAEEDLSAIRHFYPSRA